MIEHLPQNPKPHNTAETIPGADAVAFQCSVCGECCSSFNIPVDGERARHLLSLDWVRNRLRQSRRELVKINDTLYRIPLSDENTCVFLDSDKRCMIETREGKDAKPVECRNFPFASVKTPDGGTAFDTSASCKNVAESLMLGFAPIVPADPTDTPALETESLPSQIRIRGRKTLSYDNYQAWLVRVREIFLSELAPESALQQAWELLISPDAEPRHDALHRFARWGSTLTFFFLRKPYGAYSAFTLGLGRPYDDPRIFGEAVPSRGQAGAEIPPDCESMIRAFLFGLLQRKVMLSRGYWLGDVFGMASIALLLVRWYARTLALITGRSVCTTTDVAMAVRLCERYYSGHQPRFLAWFHTAHRGDGLSRLLLG